MVGGSVRAVRNVCAAAVALIAALSSDSHTVHVALRCAERPEVAYPLPVSVDGMLVVATVVMVDDKRRGNRARPIARVAFAAGVAASLAANIAAAHPSLGARLVAAWPAIALLLVVEMLARPPTPTAAHVPPVAAATHPPHRPPANRRQPATPTPSPQLPPRGASPATPTRHAARRGSPIQAQPATRSADQVPGRPGSVSKRAATTTATGAPPAAQGGTPNTPPNPAHTDPATPTPAATRRRRPAANTRELARQIMNTEPDLTRAQIAARLGLSTRRLREILNQPP